MPENRWYLFPVAFLDGGLNLKIHIQDHEGSRFWEYIEAWDQLRTPEPAPAPNPTPRVLPVSLLLACVGWVSRAVRNGWSTRTSR